MKAITINERDIVLPWIQKNYSDKSIIVVWIDSTDDCGKSFNKYVFNKKGLITDEFCIIEGTEEELKSIMQKYKAKQPYMELYINAVWCEENT